MKGYVPYTYLIGWSKYDKWYYGSKYAKNCHPKDLWVKYFTSSKNVKNFREKYGEPDVIQIRRTFNSVEEARKWEIKVIRRLKIVSDKRFLNQRNPGGIEHFSKKVGSTPWNKNKKGSQNNPFKGIVGRYNEEQLKLISLKTKEGMLNNRENYLLGLQTRDNCNNRIWINNTLKHKRIKKGDIQYYTNNGWVEGRVVKKDNFGKFMKKELVS